ncbi:VOC family protein [Chitinibacter sp. SCUT-21]|uniref:VOC family protein n=1 Tax=Chitinibacter sp. SCUT-21 TaxID=2970891 RepID=UPI0035A58E70
MQPQLSFITLAVDDLPRATVFYRDILQFKPRKISDTVVFFTFGALTLALYPREQLGQLAGLDVPSLGSAGFALSLNVPQVSDVDDLLSRAQAGGARITKSAATTSWGAYAGFFTDPDGHLWEVTWNPHFPC